MGKEAEFLEACQEGNVIKVEHLLSTKNKKYIVPLFSKTASTLLHYKDARGSTALHLASLNGRKAVVYLLLDEGADVNTADANGCLPLHLASWNGHFDIAAALISHDPRQETINALTRNQETALHFAAQYGHSNIAALLLRNGAYPSTRTLKGETPLDLASKFGRAEVVRCLLESNPNMVLNALVNDPKEGDAQAPPPFSPLHLAAKNGKTEVARLLLEAGFDVNFFTEEGTALHVAALYGKIDVVKLLLERGINADARDFHGRTALELLDEHQAGKPAMLSHLLPNRDAWRHCSTVINDHLEQSSESSSVSKEVAAIYLNALQQKQHQENKATNSDTTPTSTCDSVVWLPIPSNSLERRNFEQGILRPPSSCAENAKISQPLSVLTNFHVPPPPPSTECESICSTISLTATPTPSPQLPASTTLSAASMSPRFPLDSNLVIADNEPVRKKPMRPPRSIETDGCSYQPPPMQYDNIPRPAVYPHTAYDNVPTNTTGYDNAPPQNVHAWTHECCKSDCQQAKPCAKEGVADTKAVPSEKQLSTTEVLLIRTEAKPSPIRISDVCAKLHEERRQAVTRCGNTGTLMSVKFAEAPPETVYLPVEAKLYTRMDRPFTPTAADLGRTSTTPAEKELVKTAGDCTAVSYGPYDSVPAPAAKDISDAQKKSPDLVNSTSDVDQDFSSMKIIEQTIQIIEQSSKDMEENVDAMIRTPSRSSQRSIQHITSSRPITPPSPPKKPSKVPPPVSPKPKFLLAKIAPLAQPEMDDLGASTDSVAFRAGLFPAMISAPSSVSSENEWKTLPKRSHHRSTSRCRSASNQRQVGKTRTEIVTMRARVVKPACVDNEAQVDSGTASSECDGSICSCSGGSQCSLVNSGAASTNEDGDEKAGVAPEVNGNIIISPTDEQAEWSKIEDIFKSCGTRIARLSVFDNEIQPGFASYLKDSGPAAKNGQPDTSSDTSNNHCAPGIVEWLNSIGLHNYKSMFLENGFDRLDFLAVTLNETVLRQIGMNDSDDIDSIVSEAKKLPGPVVRAARTYRYVSDWLQACGCQDYLGEFVKNGYDTILKVVRLDVDLDWALGGTSLLGHRLRLIWSMSILSDGQAANWLAVDERATLSTGDGIKSNVNEESWATYSADYLGSELIEDVMGMEAARIPMTKLKNATKEITEVPRVVLEISWRGVQIHDSAAKSLLFEHAIENIRIVCQDERDMNFFAYITKDGARHSCHVFSVLAADIATELILTLGKAFEVAYQKALRSAAV